MATPIPETSPSMSPSNDKPAWDWTLEQTRDWLRENLDQGAPCPCCTQFAKVYRRRIHATLARSLVYAANTWGMEWFHLSLLDGVHRGVRQADFPKLVHWGLVEPHPLHGGQWRVTWMGTRFVKGVLTVRSHALIYDGAFMGYDGDKVTIHQCLPKGFDLAELMGSEGVNA